MRFSGCGESQLRRLYCIERPPVQNALPKGVDQAAEQADHEAHISYRPSFQLETMLSADHVHDCAASCMNGHRQATYSQNG
jgi:hypothetical protein